MYTTAVSTSRLERFGFRLFWTLGMLLALSLPGSAALLAVLPGAAAAAAAVGSDDPPAGAITTAADLLHRLAASDRLDLVRTAGLTTAAVDRGIVVRSYPELQPIYSLHALMDDQGRTFGIASISADGSDWLWYSLGAGTASFPSVTREEAAARATSFASGLGLNPAWEERVLVRLPDKRVYWMYSTSGSGDATRCFVDIDGQRPILSNRDGSLSSVIARGDSGPRPMPPPGWHAPETPRSAFVRPTVWVIPDIPFHFQSTSWYCGCASVQMLLDHYGEEVGQIDISDVENDNIDYGTYADDNRRACHFSGMSTAIQSPNLRGYRERALGYAGNEAWLYSDPYNGLKDQIASGTPVEICTCYDGSCSSGHFRVVKGYDDGLNEFIVHDPWYGSPFYGPDVHFNQQFLVESLWDPWTSCWGLTTGPWQLRVTMPAQVEPGTTFQAAVDVLYPGKGPFRGQYPAASSTASIELPPGFTLAGGPGTISLPAFDSGDSVRVIWNIVAGASPGLERIGFRARGIVTGHTYHSYSSYSDSIGGRAGAEVVVGPLPTSAWGADERLTNNGSSSRTSFPNGRSLYIEPDGTMHAVWADGRDGNSEIYYRRWHGTWSPEVRLTQDTAFSESPVITGSEGGRLYVVWVDGRTGNRDLFFRSCNGSAWSAETQLSTVTVADIAPSIAADRFGVVHVAWQTLYSASTKVSYRMWDGSAWSSVAVLAGGAGISAYLPSLAVSPEGRAYLLYEQDAPARAPGEIYCRVRDGSWSDPVSVSQDAAYSHCPSAAVGTDGRLHVVWYDGRDQAGDILYRSFDGAAWGPEVRVVEHGGDSEFASVATDPQGRPHVVWVDYRDGNAEIYHKEWDGLSWSADERLTRESHVSSLPCLGFAGSGRACVLWTDERDGNAEIYLKATEVDPADVGDPAVQAAADPLELRAWPSPTAGSALIQFRLSTAGAARLELFDAGGRRVRTLLAGRGNVGVHRVSWDGRDEQDAPVAGGVYWCRLEADGRRESRQLVVLRP